MRTSVLVVDDEAALRNYARDVLELEGFGVLLACDGIEAVELFRHFSSKIGLVLLDVGMPRMNGEETLLELQAIEPEVRVLICSGGLSEVTQARLKWQGVLGFISKPYKPAQLVARARELLEV